MKAFVLVKVSTGFERNVMDTLRDIPSLEEIHFLFGDFDYILTFDVPDTTTLARLVSRRVRRVPGIDQTITLVEAPI